jgi:hypothetical protein
MSIPTTIYETLFGKIPGVGPQSSIEITKMTHPEKISFWKFLFDSF